MSETVTITKEEYDELIKDQKLLARCIDAIEESGVDYEEVIGDEDEEE